MVSLTDVGNLRRTHLVRGVDVDITGITADSLVVLIDRFPEFRKMLADRAGDLTAEDLKTLGPPILAALCAAGTGKPGDKTSEAIARSLGFGEQIELLVAILDVTFPKGLGHFVESVQYLGVAQLVASVGGGKVADTRSSSRLNGLLQEDTVIEPGPTHPVN